MIKTVARTLYGFANAAACREDQLEEGVEICLVGGRRIGYRTIGNYIVRNRLLEDHPTGNRAIWNRVIRDRSPEDRPTGNRTIGNRIVRDRPPEDNPKIVPLVL